MDRHTIEVIECCRPGSDDLNDPAFVEIARKVEHDPLVGGLFRQSQARDALIVGAIEDVSVPEGLAERILQRLNLGAPDGVEAIDPPVTERSAALAATARLSRRRWIEMAAALAATVLVALALGRWLQPAGEQSLEVFASRWLVELQASEGHWQEMISAPRSAPFPDTIAGSPDGWRKVDRGRAVAYRIALPNAGNATLFVARVAADTLPNFPPATPQSTTGGVSMGFWKDGSHVYALVVQGNAQSYRAFLRRAPTPLA
jgi:hypothetical protein